MDLVKNKQKKICVLGGTGFLGQHLVPKLIASNYEVQVVTRKKVDVHDLNKLTEHVRGSDIIINLVGILNEKGHNGDGFYYNHTKFTEKVINACVANGIRKILHVSALNASTNAPSFYLKSKGEAEHILRMFSSDKNQVVIFRPSVIFGNGDGFFNRFVNLLRFIPLVFPLACANTRFAPVFVGDIVDCITQSLENTSQPYTEYNLCGPNEYTLRQLVAYTAALMGKNIFVLPLPMLVSKMQAMLMEFVPGKPFSIDNFNSCKLDSVCSDSYNCRTKIEDVVPSYIGIRND